MNMSGGGMPSWIGGEDMESYSDWLARQAPERREASALHMLDSIALGVAHQDDPHGAEAKRLTKAVADYYRKWG